MTVFRLHLALAILVIIEMLNKGDVSAFISKQLYRPYGQHAAECASGYAHVRIGAIPAEAIF